MEENKNIKIEANVLKNKNVVVALGMLLIFAVVVIALLRDRIVSQNNNQVTVYGQGKIAYQSDEAMITLGLQVDKVMTSEDALRQINEKMIGIIAAIKELGIDEKEIKTQNYSVNPHYDYNEGISNVSGYDASQNLVVKVKDIKENSEMISQIISVATKAGANRVNGINFSTSNINEVKQQARILAIKDAKSKSGALFQASGVRVGKILGWYENFIQSPDTQNNYADYGMGGMAEVSASAKVSPTPQLPAGTQEVIVEIGLNYAVK